MTRTIPIILLCLFSAGLGCHVSHPRAATRAEAEGIGGRVGFETGTARLESPWKKYLADRAALLKQHRKVTVILEGHADRRGSEEYNLALGDRRARKVKWELVQDGIDPSRIVVVSFGEGRPVQEGQTPSAHRANRRVEIVVK